MTDFLTSQEVAERLGVSPRQVSNLVRARRLPCVKHGRNLRFPRIAWEAWVDSQGQEALASVQGGSPNA